MLSSAFKNIKGLPAKQSGIIHPSLLLILAGLGIAIYFLIANTAPLTSNLLNLLYPKPPTQAATGVININPAIRHQTMIGWEATSQAGHPDQNLPAESPVWNVYKDYLLDQTVNDLGINRLRIEAKSEVVNAPFDLTGFDAAMTHVAMPMKQRLEARGEKLWINICVNDSGLKDNPTMYAQEVLRTYRYMEQKYGVIPDFWEVALEPDVNSWGSSAYNAAINVGKAMIAAGDLLTANGYPTYFVAPSYSNQWYSMTHFDTIMAMPGASKYLKELSYHLYSGVADSNWITIGQKTIQHNINSSMLEHIGGNIDELYKDLTLGRVSAWQKYTLAFRSTAGADANWGQYYWIDESATTPQAMVNIGRDTKFLRQYFKYIRKDAVRIEATSQNANLNPTAFVNKDGKYVVVVNAGSGGGSFDISGLPAGTYGIFYTTAAQYNVILPDQTMVAGQNLATSIPGGGTITIYGKTASSPLPTPVSTSTPQPTPVPTPTPSPLPTPTSLPTPTPIVTPTPTPLPLGAPSVSITKNVTCLSTGGTSNIVTLSWVNTSSVSADWIDISTNSTFPLDGFYNKGVTNLTSTFAPNNFLLYPSRSSTLTILPNTTYFVRSFNSSSQTHSSITSFFLPLCSTPTPIPTSTPTPLPTPTPTIPPTPSPTPLPPTPTPFVDNIPPSAPSSLSATSISTTQINLSWGASTDNVGVVGYKVYRDNVEISTNVSSTSYGDTNLTPSTTYTYFVKAFDAANNLSLPSNTTSATTKDSVVVSTGSILGKVIDANSTQPIPGVRVSYFVAGIKSTTTTDSGGVFNILNIPSNTYSLTLNHRSYKRKVIQITITPNTTTNQIITLDGK